MSKYGMRLRHWQEGIRKQKIYWICIVLVFLGLPDAGRGVQGSFGLEYDDNPFTLGKGERGSWGNRFYMVSSGTLISRQWGQLRAKHQWGLKHFWNEQRNRAKYGQIIANQLDLEGTTTIGDHLHLSMGGEVKIKDVSKVVRQQGYLHTAIRGSVQGTLGTGITGGCRWLYSGDTARNLDLVDLTVHEMGFDLSYQRGHSLEGRMGLTLQRLHYDRMRLVLGEVEEWHFGSDNQRDIRLEWTVGVQLYRAMLTDISYTWLNNHSNSLGYDFRAQRLQLLMSRHLTWGIDGQAYLRLQRRNYQGEVRDPLPFGVNTEDEYLQSVVAFKLSRRLTNYYGLSVQYRYSSNDDPNSEGFYRKNSYGLSLDFSI